MREWDTKEYRDREQQAIEALRAKHPKAGGISVLWAGWIGLTDDYLTEIEALLPEGHRIVFLDVTEKMGGARVRLRVEPPLLQDTRSAIHDLDTRKPDGLWWRSFRTCQVCGEAAGIRCSKDGWFTVRCEEHADGTTPWKPEDR
ncbi:hypothetical protein [Tianweitania sediminis]|uniref:Uncharacterized protein n=1 Tax=Tianweitania sediminis TaxID=1502156 RepID=A0A8J7QYM1_9HYPH|nr:hypothetical protein [Tianweitania sediminis]MBP0439133.1 hypothetical protein [Tianweitania sediminis]